MFDNFGLDTREHDAEEIDVLLAIANSGRVESLIPSLSWGRIQYIPLNGGKVYYYPVTQAGRDAACAKAAARGVAYVIWCPTCNIPGDFTVPAYGVLASIGNRATFTGKCNMGLGAGILGISVAVTGSSAGEILAVECPEDSEINFINNCGISAVNSGSGNARGVKQTGDGETWIWGSAVDGSASGGGNGYGVEQAAGTVNVSDDGKISGSTGKFLGTVNLFSFDDVIKLKTPGSFTKLYNSDTAGAGLAAAIAASASGDVLELPPRTIGGNHTNKAGVEIVGKGENSKLSGAITNNGILTNCNVTGTLANNAIVRNSIAGTKRIFYEDGSGNGLAYETSDDRLDLNSPDVIAVGTENAVFALTRPGTNDVFMGIHGDAGLSPDPVVTFGVYDLIGGVGGNEHGFIETQNNFPFIIRVNNIPVAYFSTGGMFGIGDIAGGFTPDEMIHSEANIKSEGYYDAPEIATPSNPDADRSRLYPKDDGGVTKWYYLRSDGTEIELGAAGDAQPTDGYWEPAVVAAGEEIFYTSDGDIAMIWIQ